MLRRVAVTAGRAPATISVVRPSSRPTQPALGRDGAPVPVVVVPDWPATFGLSSDVERALAPWPAWVVPTGVAVGVGLVVATGAATAHWRLFLWLGMAAFVGAWAFLAFAIGPRRVDGAAYAVAAGAWTWGAWSTVVGPGGSPRPAAMAFVVAGIVGNLLATASRRRHARRQRSAVGTLRATSRGVRTDAWVVRRRRRLSFRELTLLAADGSELTWSAEYRGGAGLRPSPGHPVAVWTAEDGRAVVVLAPRDLAP